MTGEDEEGQPTGEALGRGQMVALREVVYGIAVSHTVVCLEDDTELFRILAKDLLRHTKGRRPITSRVS